ncbi:homocysteine S-methyltransferase [Paenibacillus albidus]|uniref:homocysteine S-methyltransferase n=1 Tax=Paenibacillus albidus TaxID=2041023 RepID=UPI0016637B95|nr:homocysteine S-methyltransferase [Paenibacillus albidus]
MNPIEHILAEFPVLILDGALSTELEHRGCNINDPLWSAKILLENPDLIGQVHTDYFAAGADCAITASYQATIDGFVRQGLSGQAAAELIRKSVELAVQAREGFWAGLPEERQRLRPRPLVAASIGPYGAFLADGSEYRGDYKLTEEELMDFHRPRMKLLLEAGADILACETLPCLLEAQAIVKLLEEFPGAYAWISFSAKDGLHTSNGELIADCATWLDKHEQVAALGVNCTSPQYIGSLIGQISLHTKKPVLVYPNSGEQYDAGTRNWQGASCQEGFGERAKSWYHEGARLLGGCCRTTPEDIRTIAKWAR